MPSARELAAAAALGCARAGAVHLDECRSAGMTDDQVRWLVTSGRWQALWPRVYVAFSGPIPLVTRQHAALLYAGAGGVLSHESAGQLWRLCPTPAAIHLVVPYARQVDDQTGLRLHRSRTLTADDAHPVFSPARTTGERTVLDLLAGRPTGEAALALVADALRQRATTPERLRAALQARRRTRWRTVVLAALPDLRSGAESVLELKDAAVRRRHGLPAGERQHQRLAGGVEHLDVVIVEWRLHVELDGRLGHDRASEVWRDMRRDNRSERDGLRQLRYGWADLVDRPCEVAIEQRLVLRQQDWRGVFRRCPSCPDRLPPGL